MCILIKYMSGAVPQWDLRISLIVKPNLCIRIAPHPYPCLTIGILLTNRTLCYQKISCELFQAYIYTKSPFF
jgi:hypothetical protein